jgi:hypothetical protein
VKVFKYNLQRPGESDEDYDRRLKDKREENLIKRLQHHFKHGQPFYFFLEESAASVKARIEADPELWQFILCMERTWESDHVMGNSDLVNDMISV